MVLCCVNLPRLTVCLLHDVTLVELSPILQPALYFTFQGVDAFPAVLTVEDKSLLTGGRRTALHTGLLTAGQTELTMTGQVITGLGWAGGDTGLVAGPGLALQS